jgi:hypothetical protein
MTAVLAVSGARQLYHTATKPDDRWLPVPREAAVEYRLARWLEDRKPAGRIFASGGLRFRLNSWFDLPQVGGTFETGLRNRIPLHFAYQVRTGIGSKLGADGADAVLQLKAMAVEYVVVHGPRSEEYYRDVPNAAKFEGVLERVHSDGDNHVYRVPFHSYAHLMRANELPIHHHPYWLPPYVAAMEDPARPRLRAQWNGPNELRIQGPVPAGYSVVALLNHDPGWTAEQDNRPIALEATKLGAILIHAQPSANSKITLRYAAPTEPRLMAALSALTWLLALAPLFRRRRPG